MGGRFKREGRYEYLQLIWGSLGSSAGEESACNAGDSGSIPGSGSSPGEGIGYPLQYSWASLVAQVVKNLPCRQPRSQEVMRPRKWSLWDT